MDQFYILDGLKVAIDMESVMLSIDCKKDSPIYEEMVEEYEELLPAMQELAEPVGIIGFGVLPDLGAECAYPAGTKVIYAVTSIGDGIKQCSSRAFAEGNYVRGMLCDAIADSALFSMEDQVQKKLKAVCGAHGVGIVRRMEAPYDVPMEVQKAAWECLQLEDRFGIRISSGYMFDPVKTSCQVYVLTEDADVFKAQHDCRNCPNVNCKLRKVPGAEIKVQKGSETGLLQLRSSESLMDGLLREGYYISAVCGGKGRCGKCKVRILEGNAVVTDEDRKVFSKAELLEGWRLSCMQYPLENLTISFALEDEAEFEAVSSHADAANSHNGTTSSQSGAISSQNGAEYHQSDAECKTESGRATAGTNGQCNTESARNSGDARYEIAIDIGTTTIALELLEKESKKTVHTVTSVNSQRKYGADVIARIQAASDGKAQELQNCIRSDLQKGISALIKEAQIEPEQITEIIISGNTTMGHLLMGYDCSGLGVYPFTPFNIDFISGSMDEILRMPGTAEVVLLPGISTYVGADITAGMYACGFADKEEICLLVDLGTNGEMALGNRERILVTSTAAGPAFEGGNIKWGMGSVAGAICSVTLEGAAAKIQTIRQKAPIGICGTGVLETVAELLREELVDETGLLGEEYFDDGFPLAVTEGGEQIVFTQKDVREIQLAKAAIRAGVETLLLRYGIGKEQVSQVYLAGGFGYRLDTEKAIAIGMLPKEFEGRITAVGNSSLAGAAKYLKDGQGDETLQRLVQISEEVGLSSDKDFNEFYMDSMMFEME